MSLIKIGKLSARLLFVVVLIGASFVGIIQPKQAEASTTATVYSTASDGSVIGGPNAVYNTAWSEATGDILLDVSTQFDAVGQQLNAGNYQVFRGFLYFDTSFLGTNAVITSASLNLYGAVDNSATDFNIQLQNGQPTFPHNPLVLGDYNKANYSGNGGQLTSSGFSVAGYNSLALNLTGIGYINLTGTTKLTLRSDNDIAGTSPTQKEYVEFWNEGKGGGFRPYLSITYTTTPTVTVSAASNVLSTSARINGNITDTGGDNPTVTMYWGTSDGLQNPINWDHNVSPSFPTQPQGVSAFYTDITGLSNSTLYYFSASATNSIGTSWPVASLSFTTSSVVATVTLSAAGAITTTTATINGNITATGGNNPTVTMYWGTTDGLQVAGNWQHNSAPTAPAQPQGVAAFHTDITGLTHGTKYYFSAKATNSAGTSWPVVSLFFTTSVDAPAISAVTESNLSNTTATLNSNITNDGGDTAACQVQFGYGTASESAANFGLYNISAGTGFTGTYSQGDNPLLNITGLTPATTYYFRAQVKNSNSTQTSANEISFTTTNSLGSVTNFSGVPDQTSIGLTWGKATGSSNTYIYEQTTPFIISTPTLTNGTGTATGSPITLVIGANTVTVTAAGNFYCLGINGTATSGTATLAGSPVTLDGGNDLLDTGATTGTFVINVTSINPNPNLLYNPSVEIGDPATGYSVVQGTAARSNVVTKVGTYSEVFTVTIGQPFGIFYQQQSVIPNLILSVGNTYTYDAWVWSSTPNTARIYATDGIQGNIYSTYHPGDSQWHELTTTITSQSAATTQMAMYITGSGNGAYIDGAVVILGNTIPSQGTLIYSGTGTNYNRIGLTAGTTYYYNALGYSSGIYSSNPLYLTITTLGTQLGLAQLPTPALPANMFSNTDTSSTSPFANFQPIYGFVVDAASSMGMSDANSISAGMALFGIAIIGLLILIATHSVSGALFISAILMTLCVPFKILPWEFIGLDIPMFLGAWATARGEGNNV
jgi:hypothetical protein